MDPIEKLLIQIERFFQEYTRGTCLRNYLNIIDEVSLKKLIKY